MAKRYARALLGLSADSAQHEIWGVELEKLAKIVEAPEIASAFNSPEVSHAAKLDAVAKITEKLELSYPMRSFASVVARHGRVEDLLAISDAYRRMLDDMLGRARATLTFAQPPQDTDVARVVNGLEAISGKKIIPAVNVETSLIGGVIVELEGKTYDGSLANSLAEAAHRLAS